MQIMLATQPDTFTNALLNTNIRLSVNISEKPMVTKIYLMRVNFAFLRSATDNLTAMFTKELRPSLNTQSNSIFMLL